MALFVADGKLVFSFSVGDQKVQIRSEEKYDDGAWHSVSSQCEFFLCVGEICFLMFQTDNLFFFFFRLFVSVMGVWDD